MKCTEYRVVVKGGKDVHTFSTVNFKGFITFIRKHKDNCNIFTYYQGHYILVGHNGNDLYNFTKWVEDLAD